MLLSSTKFTLENYENKITKKVDSILFKILSKYVIMVGLCGGLHKNGHHRSLGRAALRRCSLVRVGMTLFERGISLGSGF